VYGQSDPEQMNSNSTNSVNIQDIPLEKVRVGDIDIAYKSFAQGKLYCSLVALEMLWSNPKLRVGWDSDPYELFVFVVNAEQNKEK
jgi:hypothetical protein